MACAVEGGNNVAAPIVYYIVFFIYSIREKMNFFIHLGRVR